MTFTQIKSQLLKIVRSVRRAYRTADSAGEKLERELDRLIKRKQLIQPDDLGTAAKLYIEYDRSVQAIDKVLSDAQLLLRTPVVPLSGPR